MFKSGIFLAIITMLSRIMGLVRNTVSAKYFGASYQNDAFNSSFRIANLFRQLLGEGALGNTFIPIYNKKEKELGKEEARKLIFSVLNLLCLFLIILTIITIIFSNQIMTAIAKGFDDRTNILSGELLRIMAIYILFIGMSGMIGSVLNNFKQFIIPASTSLYFNFAMIFAAVVYKDKFGIYPVAWAVTIGGLLQLLVVLPSFFKTFGKYSFIIERHDPYLKEIFVMLLPMLLGVFGWQINVIVGQMFSSFLPAGGLTALSYANNLYLLPLGVFGTTISTIIFPTMSKATAKGDIESVTKSVNGGLKLVALLVIPSTIAFTIFANDIVKVVYGYGKFDASAVKVTAECLFFYSIGLYFNNGMQILTRIFYSNKNTKDPVKFSLISIGINILINVLLMHSMKHKGLALASSITLGINFLQLYITAQKKYVKFNNKEVIGYILKTLITSLIAAGIGLLFANSFVRIGVFALVYIALWAVPLIKGGLNEFR